MRDLVYTAFRSLDGDRSTVSYECSTLASVDQVPVRELNQDTAGVLARVERGETVEITRHGRVIGRIVPAGVGELDDWVARGRVLPATVAGPIPMPAHEAVPGSEAGQLLRDLRDEERW